MFSVERHEPALKNWHEGELKLQQSLNYQNEVKHDHTIIRSYLSEAQRIFHTSNISFLPLTTQSPLSDASRIWVSLLVGSDAYPGFISSPSETSLVIEAKTWIGDPIRQNLLDGDGSEGSLVAGVGVELWSRRRNKLAGKVKGVDWMGEEVKIELEINQTCGNCPKYISIRRLQAANSSRRPILSPLSIRKMSLSDVLPPSIIEFIHSCDTAFLGTIFTPSSSTNPNDFPSHVGCNHRGGQPGFIRVDPITRKTLVLPDLSGNRFMTSLGNISTDERVGLCLPNWKNGSVLYLTGLGKNVLGDEARKIMPRTNLLTLIEITGFIFVEDALPFREVEGTLEPSPYSPPIRYLTSEVEQPTTQIDVLAKLIGIQMHKNDLATFTFKTTKPFKYKSGQYAILDLKPLIGEIEYVHLSKGDEKSPNEDGIRTWTISSSPPVDPNEFTDKFSLTIQRIHKGRITNLLFTYAKQSLSTSQSNSSPHIESLELPLLGIGGSFTLPPSSYPNTSIIYIAGGIGLTPFLSFIRRMVLDLSTPTSPPPIGAYSIKLILATREPKIMLDLIKDALGKELNLGLLELGVEIFSTGLQEGDPEEGEELKLGEGEEEELSNPRVIMKKGRIQLNSLSLRAENGIGDEVVDGKESSERKLGTQIYLCGPSLFEENVLNQLMELGVKEEEVKRESFKF